MEAGMRAVVVAVVVGVVFPGVALAQLAPASQAEFEQRFTGWTLLSDAPDCNEGNGIDPVTFIGPGRFETNGLEAAAGCTTTGWRSRSGRRWSRSIAARSAGVRRSSTPGTCCRCWSASIGPWAGELHRCHADDHDRRRRHEGTDNIRVEIHA